MKEKNSRLGRLVKMESLPAVAKSVARGGAASKRRRRVLAQAQAQRCRKRRVSGAGVGLVDYSIFRHASARAAFRLRLRRVKVEVKPPSRYRLIARRVVVDGEGCYWIYHTAGYGEIRPARFILARDYRSRPMAGVSIYHNMVKVRYWSRVQPPQLRGVKRGKVSLEFSGKKRTRMLDCINQWRIPADGKHSYYFVTLTYPEDYPADWRVWKADFERFRRQLLRAFPGVQALWRLELQRRGAPHYHLVIVIPRHVRHSRMIQWVTAAWAKTPAHQNSVYEGRFATNVRVCWSVRHALNYAAKYCNKASSAPDGRVENLDTIGRQWGLVGRIDRSASECMLVHAQSANEYRRGFFLLLRSVGSRYAERLLKLPNWQGYRVYGIGDVSLTPDGVGVGLPPARAAIKMFWSWGLA